MAKMKMKKLKSFEIPQAPVGFVAPKEYILRIYTKLHGTFEQALSTHDVDGFLASLRGAGINLHLPNNDILALPAHAIREAVASPVAEKKEEVVA